MAELVKSQALVLQSIRWHETSKIVTLYTRQFGLIKAIARGVFRKNNPLAGRLETLNLIWVVISFKETRELQIITAADLIDTFQPLKSDLDRLPYALSILELVQKLLQPAHRDEIFFDFIVQMIRAMVLTKYPLVVLWYFLLKLSSYLGFKPDLDYCSICHKKDFTNGAYFILQKGGLVCMDCANHDLHQLKLSEHDLAFLQKLQTFPHKKIHELETKFGFSVDFTALLLQYLNIHVGHRIHLEALRLVE